MLLTTYAPDESVADLPQVQQFRSYMNSNKQRISMRCEDMLKSGSNDEEVWTYLASELYTATEEDINLTTRTAEINSCVFDTTVKMEQGLNFLLLRITTALLQSRTTQNWGEDSARVYDGLYLDAVLRVVALHWTAELKQEYLTAADALKRGEPMTPEDFVRKCLENRHMRNVYAHPAEQPATHTVNASGQVVPISKTSAHKASVAAVREQREQWTSQPTSPASSAPPPRGRERPKKTPSSAKSPRVPEEKIQRSRERRDAEGLVVAINAINSGDPKKEYPRRQGATKLERGCCWNCREKGHLLFECKKPLDFNKLKEAREAYTLNRRLYSMVPTTKEEFVNAKRRWKEVQARRAAGKPEKTVYFSE
jgi:hypothetical protein